jgi:hypothetical protein
MVLGIFLQYGGYYGGYIGDVLNQWSELGLFAFILPFLLIFAIVYGILSKTQIFGKDNNRAIDAIIALVVGLMALQFDFVPVFFAEIFPRLGVGLAIILTLLIMTALFFDTNKGFIVYTLLGIGAIITIVILVTTANNFGWSSGFWWAQNWPLIALGVFILIIIGVIVGSANPKPHVDYRMGPLWRSGSGPNG